MATLESLGKELIGKHNDLVNQLEVIYMNRINHLFQQKCMILMNLQRQFNEQRNRIKQVILSKRDQKLQPQINANVSHYYYLQTPIKVKNDDGNEESSGQAGELKKEKNENIKRSKQTCKQISPPQRALIRKKHKCSICNKSFVTPSKLQRHIRTHSKKRPFKCTHPKCGCNKGFTHKKSLDDHIKRVLGIMDFKCTDCGKAFVRSHELVQHMRVHSGERPFECKHCNKRFKQLGHLTKHTKRFHE